MNGLRESDTTDREGSRQAYMRACCGTSPLTSTARHRDIPRSDVHNQEGLVRSPCCPHRSKGVEITGLLNKPHTQTANTYRPSDHEIIAHRNDNFQRFYKTSRSPWLRDFESSASNIFALHTFRSGALTTTPPGSAWSDSTKSLMLGRACNVEECICE